VLCIRSHLVAGEVADQDSEWDAPWAPMGDG
jgi:hypothetical protein